MKTTTRSLALLLVLCVGRASAQGAQAQCATWDDDLRSGGVTFYPPDWTTGVQAHAMFDDGSGAHLYVGGDFRTASGAPTQFLARWNGMKLEPLPGLQINGPVYALRVWDDGTGPALYVGGSFTAVGSASISRLAKFDGAQWTQVGSGIDNGAVWALDVFDDGTGESLYAGGTFSHVGGLYRPGITRWDGTSYSFIPGVQGGASTVLALTHHDDGSGPALFAGGSFATAGGVVASSLARWNGVQWSAVGTWPNQEVALVHDLAVHTTSAGTVLVAAGQWRPTHGSTTANTVATWDGVAWQFIGAALGTTNFDYAHSLLSIDLGDGNGTSLFVGGSSAASGGYPVGSFSRWNGSTWTALGGGAIDGPVTALLGVSDAGGIRVHVGGAFDFIGASHAGGVAVLDALTIAPLETGTSIFGGRARAMVRFDDGSGDALYVAGDFSAAGNTRVNRIARFDGTNWTSLGEGSRFGVSSLAVFDAGAGPQLYAGGGSFKTNAGATVQFIARWNGSGWEELPSATGLQIIEGSIRTLAVCDDGGGPALFVGGAFKMSGFVTRSIMGWRNGAWFYPGTLVGEVNALAVHDDGTGPALYAGGKFDPYALIMKWTGSAWTTLGTGLSGASFSGVYAIASYDDGSGPALFAGGRFTTAGGAPAKHLARWKSSTWSPVGVGAAGPVTALAVHDEGVGRGPVLVIGGQHDDAGATSVGTISRFDGTTLSTLATVSTLPNSFVEVTALASWDDGTSRDLFVSGAFQTVNGQNSIEFARLAGCEETGRTACYGDGAASACPCANESAGGDRAGCRSSIGLGATLRGQGRVSVSDDTAQLIGGSMPNGPALYFQGTALNTPVMFGDGVNCTGGQLLRLGIRVNAGQTSTFPGPGSSSLSSQGLVSTPGTRHYQVRYRDSAAFCTSDTFSYTNAVSLVWGG